MTEHPWKLVGPWYRAQSVGGESPSRDSAPVIQKYAAADFANKIVDEPQASLRFNSEDFVTPIKLDPHAVIDLAERAQSSSPLKLFLDLHSRFYVVVCELHCDVAGFPSVSREKVCEAGFVIRRRVPRVTPGLEKQVSGLLRERSQLRSDLLRFQSTSKKATVVGKGVVNAGLTGSIKAKANAIANQFQQANTEKLAGRLQANIASLNAMAQAGDLSLNLQGWKPTDLKGVGNWQDVEETPEELDELVIPMFPLIADPNTPSHSATGKTMWFGVIPTASSDTDSQNNPRFDDSDLYEVRCFVRKYCCPDSQQAQKGGCGELVWSQATEPYQLATPYDLDGNSHRPVNIKLPDLDALKAQANLGPPGRGVSGRIIAPENSSLNFATDNMEMPQAGDPLTRPGQQICFFAIFLFFIVAMFLFRLFLPILLFLFQLWFLLKLKFCIPPSISIDAGLVADLEFDGSFGVDFDVSVDAHVELMAEFSADLAVQMAVHGPDLEAKFAQPGFSITVNQGKDNEKTYSKASALSKDVSLMITNGINASDDMRGEMANGGNNGEGLMDALPLNELASIYIAMKTEYEDGSHPELAGELPTSERGLVYFDVIALSKVAA